jgi:hypothetical protein
VNSVAPGSGPRIMPGHRLNRREVGRSRNNSGRVQLLDRRL